MAYFNLSDPANHVELLTPGVSDIVPSRALYIGVAGNISFIDVNGSTTTNMPVLAGAVLPFRITRLTAATASVYALR